MRIKIHSKELIQMAGELYVQLKSCAAVAKKLEVGTTTAHRLIKKSGVPIAEKWSEEVSQNRRKFQGELAAAVVKDYEDNMKLKDMAAKYESSEYAIRTAVKAAGAKRRGRGGQGRKINEKQANEMIRLYVFEEWAQVQIAVKFKCSQIVVSRILRAAGVDCGKKSGSAHPAWKGGIVFTPEGYVLEAVAADDPLAVMRNRMGYVLQHRLVLARQLNRPLTKNESVHHIDGDKQNNKPDNLQLRIGQHGKGVCLRCADCGSINIQSMELAA